MNTSKIDFQGRIQQNHGMIGDLALHSFQSFGNQQTWNMGIRAQSPVMESAHLQQQNLRPDKSSSSIMRSFESPASAFYATERYMGFPQYDCQVNAVLSCPYSKSYDSQIPSQQSSGEIYVIDAVNQQPDHNLELRNNLQSITKSHLSDDHYYKSYKGVCSNSLGNKLHQLEQNKLSRNGAVSVGNQFSIPFYGDQDHNNHNRFGSNPFVQLGVSSRQEMQSPRFSSGVVSVSSASSGNSMATGAVLSSKTRIRWTQDLHEKFVECVNRLGGADKATPKAILKLMDSDGLTIFHVKSHLQKYRIAKYMPDSSEGKAEKRTSINDVSQMDPKTGLQITEALQLQLDVQRRLHEQLEIQKNLQLRIEEQGRQLKRMFDQQQRTNNNLFRNQNLDSISPDEQAFSLEDIEISFAEGSSNNSHFPSKIS
ncbi:myb family transcription factor PHL5 isoform X2 [Ricinus communis]|uniref:Transcription factor, putative n=1 Tax=Ricinus communis TaxID=3988 RepID=B9SWI3_RICCO|nr:myb family transcription factor PHL5 isoform X2 [Ricinus communis]EEF32013.1 transcription factor, putative [Ricinus communis]|eukprot:XP_002530352.1 myb family transcription factor PHL5 isoform X2 [Ricinus communis]